MYLWLSYLPPMCKVTDGYSQHGDFLCFSTKQTKKLKKKKIKNDLLTFPKWIICTDVPMTSLDFFQHLKVWVLCRSLTCVYLCVCVRVCV